MNDSIISLTQTSVGQWQAKYNGNYGIYNIKIQLAGERLIGYSCSCPSDYSPCKDIGYVMESIQEQAPITGAETADNSATIEELLEKIPHKELKDFISRYAKYNTGFLEKMRLEFLGKLPNAKADDYNLILRKALRKVRFDYDDLYEYSEDYLEIDVLDECLHKAENLVSQASYDEAIAMLKAIVSEYAVWAETIENDILERMVYRYTVQPFDLLTTIALSDTGRAHELFEYALSEVKNPIYREANMDDGFHNMLMNVAQTPGQTQQFLDAQEELLRSVLDKSSHAAEHILNRIIAIYRKNNKREKVAAIIEDNLQINSYCKLYVEQKIAAGDFAAAKKQIADLLSKKENISYYDKREWNKMLLTIAIKENDVPTIRMLAFSFISDSFNAEYYRLFKSTFPDTEWPLQLNMILNSYGKARQYFSESKANVLVEENDAKQLMDYVEKYLSPDRLEKYYTYFKKEHPNETLNLFLKAVNVYAESNTGRSHYEYIVTLLARMKSIAGGKEMVNEMVAQYKQKYKNRRAMMEILNRSKI